MLRILESQFIGNLADRLVTFQYPFFGKFYDSVLDVFLCCFSCFFLDQVTEIIWGKADFIRKVFDRRKPFGKCNLILKIILHS